MKTVKDVEKLRILYLIDGLPAGGLERQVVELLKGLKSISIVSTVLCSLSKGGAREKEAFTYADQIIDCNGAANAGHALLLKFPYLLIKILLQIGSLRPDIIHTYGCFSDWAGVFAKAIYGIPLANGSIRAARPFLNRRDKISKLTFRYADAVVANSTAGLNSFKIKEKGIVIHNGIDMSRFGQVSPVKIDGFPKLCMVGNFTDKKDQKSLILTIPELSRIYRDLKVILVGRGKNLIKCKELSNTLDCAEFVTIVDNCDNPEPYIAASDICLLLTNMKVHGEGISNSIMEYMALGKPVIASDCGGNDELVEEGITGFLCTDNSPMVIANHIKTLMNDGDMRKKMGNMARQTITKKFSIVKMIEAYVELYEELPRSAKKG